MTYWSITKSAVAQSDTSGAHTRYHELGLGELIIVCLTLILLMWRIWWAPNNASRQQMGFNSAFKGL